MEKILEYKKNNETIQLENTVEFDAALQILQNTNESLFITGKAGCGKSTLLNYFVSTTEKTVAVFQDANPEAAVIVYDVNPYDMTDYSIKIKMGKPGTVTVVVEGQDGKLYAAKKTLDVAKGGCEG